MNQTYPFRENRINYEPKPPGLAGPGGFKNTTLMKHVIIALLVTLLSMTACKKEDEGPKIIKELHGGLYEDGTWAPMAYHKVLLIQQENNYPFPPTYKQIASDYTDEQGKYSFLNIDFQSHRQYYLYYFIDDKKYYELSAFSPGSELNLYDQNDRVQLLTGRAKVKIKIRSKDGKRHTFSVGSSRTTTKSFINSFDATEILECKALITDTLVFSWRNPTELSYLRPTFYTYINDTAYIEINF